MKKEFSSIVKMRKSCKSYTGEKISQKDIEYILEAARWSPTSFGVEHARFIVVKDKEKLAELTPLMYGQKQVTDCSHMIFVCALQSKLRDMDYVGELFSRTMGEHESPMMKDYYAKFLSYMDDAALSAWSHKQCYIYMTNICNAATALGHGSGIYEGIDYPKMSQYLKLEEKDLALSYAISVGVKDGEPRDSERLPLSEIVEYF